MNTIKIALAGMLALSLAACEAAGTKQTLGTLLGGVGGAVALFAVGAAWVSTLGLYAKVRHLYLLGKVRPAEPAEAAPMEGEAATVSRAARLARGVVVVLERLDHELALPGFVLAAGVGRVDWWVVGAGSLRLLTGATAVAKATYAGVVTLNLPRG